MFDKEEFTTHAHTVVDWIAAYLSDVEKFPVCPDIIPGSIQEQLPEHPPAGSDDISEIFNDFTKIILPGITHWQSPSFHAYFPANNSTPSVLAEFITAALGVQGMKWLTSPACTELEQVTMKWFRQMLDLPEYFTGVIQDTASVATLCALLVARERSLPSANKRGMKDHTLRVYCSSEAHSSVEKAVRIAGFGSDNLVKIPVDRDLRMQAFELRNAIATDILNGFTPTCIVAALGTTGTCSIDPIGEIAEIAKINSIWLHVDAAFAGTAMILPEFRSGISGIDKIDSFVFNPHKWMFTNFDCSVFFVRDKQLLEDTFRLVPDYLKSEADAAVNDFSNYGIQLGRRFRALKLWFVIRYYGIEGLRRKIRKHIDLAEWFENEISKHPDFELVTPRTLAVICFRYRPVSLRNEVLVNNLNETLLARINKTGKVFLSHTIVDGKFALRMVSAQTEVEMRHMEKALEVLLAEAAQLKKL